MIGITFIPWAPFRAYEDKAIIRSYLDKVGDESVKAFKAGMASGKSGRTYYWRGRAIRASAPGEYPAIRSGALNQSVSSTVTGDTKVEVGSNVFYSIFLRNGTSKMARRKMSDDALKEGIGRAGVIGRWAQWRAG